MNRLAQQIQKVRQASRQMVRELGLLGNESPYDLSLSYRHVLIELDLSERLTQQALTERLILDKSTMSRIIKKLAALGLVNIETGDEDRRFKFVTLTKEGRGVVNELHQSAINNVGRALHRLSATERAQVERGLMLYASALEDARKGEANND